MSAQTEPYPRFACICPCRDAHGRLPLGYMASVMTKASEGWQLQAKPLGGGAFWRDVPNNLTDWCWNTCDYRLSGFMIVKEIMVSGRPIQYHKDHCFIYIGVNKVSVNMLRQAYDAFCYVGEGCNVHLHSIVLGPNGPTLTMEEVSSILEFVDKVDRAPSL